MEKYDLLIQKILLFLLLALIWIGVVVVPGAFLIDSITNSFIYRRLYVATTFVVGGVLIAIIIDKGLLIKLIKE